MAKIVELEINGVRLPLGPTTVSVTKQVNNIGELKDRQATFTNKFIIPNTPKAQKLFNGLGLIGNVSRIPYRILKSKLIYNGVPVLVNGNAYVTGKDSKGFHVAIYDGNIFLFQEIGNKALNELDFSDLNHALNPTTFEASFTNTEGYIYAISNNGQFTPETAPEGIQINYQIPSIFVHTIWDKIFNETSFDYSGDIFSNEKFLKLVSTMKRGYNSDLDAISNPVQLHFLGINDSINYLIEEEDINGTTLYSWSSKWDLNFVDDEGILQNGVLSILEDSLYTVDWNLDVTDIPEGSTVEVIVRKTTGGGETIFQDITINPTGVFNTTESISFQAVAGDHYTFKILISGESTITNPYNVTSNVSGDWNMVDTFSTVIEINIASFIGDMRITDFLKDIMQHFGLIIQKKQGSNVYEFKQMDDILKETSDAYNWSDIFIKTTKESYQLKGYSQKNRFAYSYFDDNVSPFADGFLLVDNHNLKPESLMLTRQFNACARSKTFLNSSPVTLTPYWEAERDDNGVITKYNPIDNKNYLAEVKLINENITFDVTGGLGVAFSGLVPRLDFQNLSYSKLIEENYSFFETFIDWNDVRQGQFRFKSQDVRDHDFFRSVYIEQLASYFYVNKIVFKGTDFGTAEIVKIKLPDAIPLRSVIGFIPEIDISASALKTATFDASGSLGKVDSYKWELISAPAGGTLSFANFEAKETIGTFNATAGNWIVQLTINAGINESKKLIKIKTA